MSRTTVSWICGFCRGYIKATICPKCHRDKTGKMWTAIPYFCMEDSPIFHWPPDQQLFIGSDYGDTMWLHDKELEGWKLAPKNDEDVIDV